MRYSIRGVMVGGRARFIALDVRGEPNLALSLYEPYLNKGKRATSSAEAELRRVLYWFTWADLYGLDLVARLVEGGVFLRRELSDFTNWLEMREKRRNRRDGAPLHPNYVNNIIDACCRLNLYYIEYYYRPVNLPRDVMVERLDGLIFRHDRWWSGLKARSAPHGKVEPISGEEVKAIYNHFQERIRASSGVRWAVAKRDYLIWRILMELGLRSSEALLLTCEDVQPLLDRPGNLINVGIERDDPRGVNAPHAKTKRRRVGLTDLESTLPGLLHDYIDNVRPLFGADRPYLLCSRAGAPLSRSGMYKIVQGVSDHTDSPMWWHRCRHTKADELSGLINRFGSGSHERDLMHFFGWKDPRSAKPYTENRRYERAVETMRELQGQLYDDEDES